MVTQISISHTPFIRYTTETGVRYVSRRSRVSSILRMAAELEQFCILARTLKGRACVALIQQVLSHSKIFYFGELLAVPSIQGVGVPRSFFSPLIYLQLKETENASAVKTLELFAYGTYQDYVQDQGSFLELPPNQLNKLKQLSLVSLGSSENVFLFPCRLFLSCLSDIFLFTTAGSFGSS